MKAKAPTIEAVSLALATDERFRISVSTIIANALSSVFEKPVMSQAEAYRTFGRVKVTRWVTLGVVNPRVSPKGRVDYYTAELIEAQNKSLYLGR